MTQKNAPYLVAAFYHFAELPDPESRVERYRARADALGLIGILLVASEGVNGTMAGAPTALRSFLDELRADQALASLQHKESWADTAPFRRLRVRLKREIVSMGKAGGVNDETVAAYTSYDRWNELIRDPDTVVIDVRNGYETAIGSFENAIDPETESFRDFPGWAEARADELKAAPAVAIFCTGGIRCEKAGAYLRDLGIERLFQLEGGILKYLEHADADDSAWRGGCFVFDERVSVGHGLKTLDHSLCRGCRRPLTAEDRASPLYVPGVSCAYCAPSLSREQEARRRERQKQIALANARGAAHLADTPSPAVAPALKRSQINERS